MKELVIIGASGHGKVVADIASLCGYDRIEFLDDDETKRNVGRYPVTGTSGRLRSFAGWDAAVAIGNAAIRRKMAEACEEAGCRLPVLIHPGAVVAKDVTLGEGTVVMAGAVINPGTTVGRGVIVNTCASVDHDCTVGDFVHVSVGARLCGTVTVGEATWVGAGSVISNNIDVCGGCMIGAGAVVIRDIRERGTYAGVPARRIDPGEK